MQFVAKMIFHYVVFADVASYIAPKHSFINSASGDAACNNMT